MTSLILGCDPGAHGAIAILTDGGALLEVFDMPSVQVEVGKTKRTRIASGSLAYLIRQHGPVHAFVEAVGAMPGQGTASMFSFGKAAGIIEGVLAGLAVPTTFLTPVAWKRGTGLGTDKAACRQRAMQVFPMQADQFARVKDDGRAEAALLALYGLRTMQRAAA